MERNFLRSLDFVREWEGGLVNDPHDPGGLTKYGISSRAHPDVDVARLTWPEAVALYEERYWRPAGCSGLPWPLCLVHFNAAVNGGVSAARVLLEESEYDPEAYLALWLGRYADLRTWPRHGRGWARRTADLLLLVSGPDSTFDVDRLVLHLPGVDEPVVYRGAALGRSRGTKLDVRFLGESLSELEE